MKRGLITNPFVILVHTGTKDPHCYLANFFWICFIPSCVVALCLASFDGYQVPVWIQPVTVVITVAVIVVLLLLGILVLLGLLTVLLFVLLLAKLVSFTFATHTAPTISFTEFSK